MSWRWRVRRDGLEVLLPEENSGSGPNKVARVAKLPKTLTTAAARINSEHLQNRSSAR
jgi:hypothetical protein